MALLEVHHLVKAFGGLRANDDVSFTLETGELLGVIGPNGAGKTTLFNGIAGMFAPTSGRIVFDGEDITGIGAPAVARKGLARTFQVYVAAGDLNVLENVMVGCFMKTASPERARTAAEEILDDLGLKDLKRSLVSELPVAAQKRVTMATALGTRPKLLLLDEVAAGLNPSEIEDIMAEHPPHPQRPGRDRDADRARDGTGHEHQPPRHRAGLRSQDRRWRSPGHRKRSPGHQGLSGRALRARTWPGLGGEGRIMKSPILEVNHIKVRYSGLPVLHGVSLTVNAGETVCVVGSNGAGKSTLLRAIMGSPARLRRTDRV